jgi:hypothetical protein
MTRQTRAVLFLRRVARIFGEANRDSVFATAGLDMRRAWSVAGLASELFLGALRMGERFAHDGLIKAFTLVSVTDDTGIAAGIFRSGLCRCSRCSCNRRLPGEGNSERDRDDSKYQRAVCVTFFHAMFLRTCEM